MPSEGNGREIGVGTNRARTAEGSKTKRKKDNATFNSSDKELGMDPARGMYLHFLHLE